MLLYLYPQKYVKKISKPYAQKILEYVICKISLNYFVYDLDYIIIKTY